MYDTYDTCVHVFSEELIYLFLLIKVILFHLPHAVVLVFDRKLQKCVVNRLKEKYLFINLTLMGLFINFSLNNYL